MSWDKNNEEAFPARHPREPGGLRQDILDEIADHLACATEREEEQDSTGDEETVWHRVLDKFGDPNTVVRRLWWDQMREIVMREWIQTGVLALLGIVGVAGIVLVALMMGRLNQTNDAMETAMTQVATTNEALLKVLSGLPGMGQDTESRDQYAVEVVVRRGTVDGPPAAEVTVHMKGHGENDQLMTVAGAVDEEGRTRFEKLSQGEYELSLSDPVSGLSTTQNITLFAGKGDGEYVFTAPDLTPRPVTIDWDLPDYGRDHEVLISAKLGASWIGIDKYWRNSGVAIMGHGGTWEFREEENTTGRPRKGINLTKERHPFLMAGDIVVTELNVLETNGENVWEDRKGALVNLELQPERDDTSAVLYTEKLPEEILADYSHVARMELSQEHVPDEAFGPWISEVTQQLPDAIVVGAESQFTHQWATWSEAGLELLEDTGRDDIQIDPLTQRQFALAFPLPTQLESEGGAVLAFQTGSVSKARMEKHNRGTRVVHEEPTNGNALAAYALRGALNSGATSPMADPTPFWQREIAAFTGRGFNAQFITLPASLFEDKENPVTGVLLRWEKTSDVYEFQLAVRLEGSSIEDRPCWVITAPVDSVLQAAAGAETSTLGQVTPTQAEVTATQK